MAQTTLNIRMDEELKESFEYVCDELGMSMSTAIIIYAKKMAREHRVPFEVSADPFYSEENLKALKASISQLHSGNTITKSLEELEEIANG